MNCDEQYRNNNSNEINNENTTTRSAFTTADSTVGYWHDSVVCLSVCLWRCVLWLNDTPDSKSVWTSE